MTTLIRNRLFTLVILVVMTLLVWSSELTVSLPSATCPVEQLCVVFFDVGQGDAIFIQSPSGQQMLVDGGRGSAVLRELSVVMSFFDRDLDYVLATHPDADHVGGLNDVLARYQVDNVIRTEKESDTAAWQALETAIEKEGVAVSYARRGQRYDLGAGVVLEILFPDLETSDLESNQASIVAQLRYGETEVLLTGDSPKAMEEYLVLLDGEYLKSDILKVGHHGSRTSTSELFLAEVSPAYAVISASADNSYGHPHVEVTDMLFNFGAVILNTAESGSIVFVSDGKTLTQQ